MQDLKVETFAHLLSPNTNVRRDITLNRLLNSVLLPLTKQTEEQNVALLCDLMTAALKDLTLTAAR